MSDSPYTSLSGGPEAVYPNAGQQATSSAASEQAFPAITTGAPAPHEPAVDIAEGHGARAPPDPRGAPRGNPYIEPKPSKPGVVDQLASQVSQLGRQAEDLMANLWGHLTGGQSVAHTALGKLQNLSLLTPSTAERFWRETFCPPPGEFLANYFGCHLSTTTGAVVGTLFVSTASVAFLSDQPLEYAQGHGVTSASFYKVSIPLERIASVHRSHTPQQPSDKHMQLVTVDNHHFWFLGFFSFDKAVATVERAMAGAHASLQARFQEDPPPGIPVPHPGEPAQGVPLQGQPVPPAPSGQQPQP